MNKQQRPPQAIRPQGPRLMDLKVESRLKNIKHKIIVMSGKGGVGKSFFASNLSMAIASLNKSVGLLDVDFHGPSAPRMLGISGTRLFGTENGIEPAIGPFGIKVVSIDFIVPDDSSPIVWRGAIKHNAIRQFLADVNWGELDYLVIDMPPGTGDEPLSIVQLINKIDGALIITIPSNVSASIVKRSIRFAKEMSIPVIGLVENMSYFHCPDSGKSYFIFGKDSTEKLAKEMGVDLVGKIPLDPRIAESNDIGEPFFFKYPDTEASRSFTKIAEKVVNFIEKEKS